MNRRTIWLGGSSSSWPFAGSVDSIAAWALDGNRGRRERHRRDRDGDEDERDAPHAGSFTKTTLAVTRGAKGAWSAATNSACNRCGPGARSPIGIRWSFP